MAIEYENMREVVEIDADVSGLKEGLDEAVDLSENFAAKMERVFINMSHVNIGSSMFNEVNAALSRITNSNRTLESSFGSIQKMLPSVTTGLASMVDGLGDAKGVADAVAKAFDTIDDIDRNIAANLTKDVIKQASMKDATKTTLEEYSRLCQVIEGLTENVADAEARYKEAIDKDWLNSGTQAEKNAFRTREKYYISLSNELDKYKEKKKAIDSEKDANKQVMAAASIKKAEQEYIYAIQNELSYLKRIEKVRNSLTNANEILINDAAANKAERNIQEFLEKIESLRDVYKTFEVLPYEEVVNGIGSILAKNEAQYNEEVQSIRKAMAAEKQEAEFKKAIANEQKSLEKEVSREMREEDSRQAAEKKRLEAEEKARLKESTAAEKQAAKERDAIRQEELAQWAAMQKRREDDEKARQEVENKILTQRIKEREAAERAAQIEANKLEEARAKTVERTQNELLKVIQQVALKREEANGQFHMSLLDNDLSGAQKAMDIIDQMTVKLSVLKEGLSNPDFGLGGIQDAYDVILQSVQAVNEVQQEQRQITQLVASEGTKVANGYTTVKDELLKAAAALSDLRDKQAELKNAGVDENSAKFRKLSTAIQEAEKYTDNLEDALEDLKGKPDASVQDGMDAIKKAAADAKWSVESTSQSTSSATNSTIDWKNAFKTVGRAVKDSLTPIKKGLSSIGNIGKSAFKKATSGVKGFIENLKKSKHETNLVKAAVKQTEKTMLSLYHLFRARVRRSFMGVVFADVKEYTAGIAQLSPRFNETVSDIVNSARMFGAQVIAATEPLVTTVGPYIAQFFDLLTGVADKVSQAVAVVTGNDDYIKATKGSYDYARSLEETEDNTKAVTKATKEYQATVLGFDQLNKLDGNSSSDGGVGGDADAEAAKLTGISKPGFEKAKVQTNKLNDWAKRLRKAIEDGNWFKAGNIMAEGVNKAFSWLEDVAGWSKNAEKFTKVIQNFIDFVNGFIDGLDPQVIGHAIGDVLNTVIHFFDMITDEEKGINALQLGEKIGATLLEALRTIEWETLGRAIINGLEKMVDFVNGIISTEGLFEEIGNSIAEFLNGAIENFDPDKWSNAISGLINGFFTVLKTAFGGEEGKKRASTLGTKVGTTIADIFKKINTDDAVEAIKGVSDSIRAFLGNSLNEILTGAVENFEPEKAADVLATLVNNFFGLLSDIFGDTDRAEEFGAKLGTMFSEFFNDLDADTIVNGANAVINSITGAINSFIDQVEWDSVLAKLEDVLGRINWGGLGEILAIIVGPKLLGALGGWLLSNIPKFIGFKMLLNAFKGGGGGIGGGASGGLFGIFNTAVDTLVNGFHWFGDKATEIFGLNGTVAEVLGKVGAIGTTSVIAYEGTKKGGNIGLDMAVAFEKAMNGGKLSEEREQQLEYIKGYDHPLLGEICLAVLKIKDNITGSHDYEKEVLNKTDEQIEKDELLQKSFDELKDDVAKNGGSKELVDAINEASGNADRNSEFQEAIGEIAKSGEYSREEINNTIKTLMQDESGAIADSVKVALGSYQLEAGVETNGGSTELVSDLRDIFLEYSSSAERLEHMAEVLESGDYSNEEFARTLQTMLNIDNGSVDDDTKSLLSQFMGEHGLQVEFDPSFTYGIESLSELPNKLAETISTMIADSKLDTSELSTMFNDMNREDLTQTLVDMTKNGQLGEDVQKQIYDYLVSTDSDNQRLLDLFAQNQTAGDGMVSALDTGVADLKSEMQTNESTKSERETALREDLLTWFTGVLDKLESIYGKNNEVVVNLDGERLATAVQNNQDRYDKLHNAQPAF